MTLFSCAGSYNHISSYTSKITPTLEEDGLAYSFKYDLLSESGNKKYSQKANKKGIKLLAITVENNTGRSINFKNDVDLFVSNKLVFPMETQLIYETIKQPSPLYLLWGLLWVTFYNCNNSDCNVTPIPIGLVIGVGNMIVANTSNTNLRLDLEENNIIDKEIPNGESFSGIIGLPIQRSEPISLKLKNY